jgi:hypothetical protein
MLMVRMKENKINFELVGEKEKKTRDREREARTKDNDRKSAICSTEKKMGSHSFIHQSAMNEA